MASAPETVAQDGWSALSEHTLSEHFPLHRACRDGDVEALSALVQQDAVQSHLLLEDTYYGWTPTHWAAYFGKLDCLRTLIEGVAGKRATPADVKTSRFTQTPAHIASFAGHPHCLTWLVQCGADPNAQDYLGETPLHKAVRTGSTDCIAALGKTQASVGLKNNNGQTAAQLANACGYTDIANKLLEVEKQQGIQASQNGSITRSIPAHGLNGGVFPDNEKSALVTNKLVNMTNGTHHYTSSNGYYGFQPNGSNGHVSNGQDDCEMETESPSENEPANHQVNMPVANGTAQKNGMEAMNGSANHTLHHAAMNGSRDTIVPTKNGFGTGEQAIKPVQNSGFGLSNGDITLNHGVSQNNVAIGGRKRTREELPLPEMKRRRTEGWNLLSLLESEWRCVLGKVNGSQCQDGGGVGDDRVLGESGKSASDVIITKFPPRAGPNDGTPMALGTLTPASSSPSSSFSSSSSSSSSKSEDKSSSSTSPVGSSGSPYHGTPAPLTSSVASPVGLLGCVEVRHPHCLMGHYM